MDRNGSVLFGIAAPQSHLHLPLDSEGIQAYIRRAEELGFHSLWVQEQAGLQSGVHALDGLNMLSYAAAITRRIHLDGAVFLVALRNPIELAKSLSTLDQLSRGRLIAGVGLGGVRSLYQTYGFSDNRLAARYQEALDLMQKLWTEEKFSFNGNFWQLREVNLLPKPLQKPHPPIWFGAHVSAALRRAARYGSGFIGAGSAFTAAFAEEVKIVLAALDEAGKARRILPLARGSTSPLTTTGSALRPGSGVVWTVLQKSANGRPGRRGRRPRRMHGSTQTNRFFRCSLAVTEPRSRYERADGGSRKGDTPQGFRLVT